MRFSPPPLTRPPPHSLSLCTRRSLGCTRTLPFFVVVVVAVIIILIILEGEDEMMVVKNFSEMRSEIYVGKSERETERKEGKKRGSK